MPSIIALGTPDHVAARLAAYAAEWGESPLPEALRVAGGIGITSASNTERTYELRPGPRAGSRLGVRCVVQILSDGGETVIRYDVHVGPQPLTCLLAVTALLAVPVLYSVASGDAPISVLALPPLGAGLATALVMMEAAGVRARFEPAFRAVLARVATMEAPAA